MGLLLTIAAGPRQCSHSQVRDHISLSQVRDSTYLEGQVSAFISPRSMVARLYPQALGSLFVASYVSQGYDGGIRTHLHTGVVSISNTRREPKQQYRTSVTIRDITSVRFATQHMTYLRKCFRQNLLIPSSVLRKAVLRFSTLGLFLCAED
jgi:hypothetical protein